MVSRLVLYKIFLGVAFKEPFAGGATEIEVASIVGCVMTCTGYFYRHTTDWIESSFCCILFERLCWWIFDNEGSSTAYLDQFCQDASGNLIWCDGPYIESSGCFETCDRLLGEARLAEICPTGFYAAATRDHTHIGCGCG